MRMESPLELTHLDSAPGEGKHFMKFNGNVLEVFLDSKGSRYLNRYVK